MAPLLCLGIVRQDHFRSNSNVLQNKCSLLCYSVVPLPCLNAVKLDHLRSNILWSRDNLLCYNVVCLPCHSEVKQALLPSRCRIDLMVKMNTAHLNCYSSNLDPLMDHKESINSKSLTILLSSNNSFLPRNSTNKNSNNSSLSPQEVTINPLNNSLVPQEVTINLINNSLVPREVLNRNSSSSLRNVTVHLLSTNGNSLGPWEVITTPLNNINNRLALQHVIDLPLNSNNTLAPQEMTMCPLNSNKNSLGLQEVNIYPIHSLAPLEMTMCPLNNSHNNNIHSLELQEVTVHLITSNSSLAPKEMSVIPPNNNDSSLAPLEVITNNSLAM